MSVYEEKATSMRKKYKKKKVTFACFQLLTYENDKTHAKHGIWSNAITLANKSILNLFSLLRTKTYKNVLLYKETKKTLRETSILSVFELSKHDVLFLHKHSKDTILEI